MSVGRLVLAQLRLGYRVLPTSGHDDWTRFGHHSIVHLSEDDLAVVGDLAWSFGHPDTELLTQRAAWGKLSYAERVELKKLWHPAWEPMSAPLSSSWVVTRDERDARLCSAFHDIVIVTRMSVFDVSDMIARCMHGSDVVLVTERLRAAIVDNERLPAQAELEERFLRLADHKIPMDSQSLVLLDDLARRVIEAHGIRNCTPHVSWDYVRKTAVVELRQESV